MEGVQRTAEEARQCKTSTFNMMSTTNISTSSSTSSSPLLHRIYFYRNLLVNKYITTILHHHHSTGTARTECQLLILGAGLDDYSKYKNNNLFGQIQIYCVDFPEVIESRSKQFSKSDEISLGIDITDTSTLFQLLNQHGFQWNMHTIILIEFVLSYISPSSIENLLFFLNSKIPNNVLVLYDPIFTYKTHDYHQKLITSFTKRKAPLQYISASVTDHILLLRRNGWKHIECINVQNALALYLSVEERLLPIQNEPFDEFASIALLNKIYAMTIATNNYDSFHMIKHDLLKNSSRDVTISSTTTSTNRLNCMLLSLEARLNSLENIYASQTHVIVRPTNMSDVEAAAVLFESCFSHLSIKYKAVQKFIKFSVKEIKRGRTPSIASTNCTNCSAEGVYASWVAVEQGAVIGYGAVSFNTLGGSAEVKHMCCLHSKRRQGIASKILSRILSACTEKKMTRVELSTITELSEAISLYKKFGFVETETLVQPEGYSLSHLVLDL